jgi:hypothetical protein
MQIGIRSCFMEAVSVANSCLLVFFFLVCSLSFGRCLFKLSMTTVHSLCIHLSNILLHLDSIILHNCRIFFWMEGQAYQKFRFCHWFDKFVDVTWSLLDDLLASWYGISSGWCRSLIELACKWHMHLYKLCDILMFTFWCDVLISSI